MKYILTITFTVILFSINAQEPKALFYIELDTILINKSDSIFYIKSNKPSFIIDSSYTIFYGAPGINKSKSKQLSLEQLFMIRTYSKVHFVLVVYYHEINELKSKKFGIEFNK